MGPSVTGDSRKGKVQTVLGLIEPEALGHTLMHEHLIWDIALPAHRKSSDPGPAIELGNHWALTNYEIKPLNNRRQFDVDEMCEAVSEFGEAGGKAILELTIGGLCPDPAKLKQIAERTGVTIVMGCGYYLAHYQDEETLELSTDELTARIIAQVEVGAWGTDIKAGIIGEIGCHEPWKDFEKRSLTAAAIAQQHTGAALTIHPARSADHPFEAIDLVARNGGDVSRTIMGHIDRTIFDDDRLFRLADTGCVLEFDLFGRDGPWYLTDDIDLPNDGTRIAMIRTLFDRGHGSQVVISHDICTRSRLTKLGGHGYAHITKRVLPHMLKRGLTGRDVDMIMIENPARLLTFV